MTVLVFLAMLGLALSIGGWIGIRYADAMHNTEADIARFILTVPVADADEVTR